MDSFVNEKDFQLLAQDPYTFSVLDRILRGNCDLVRTDHRNPEIRAMRSVYATGTTADGKEYFDLKAIP